MCVGVGVWVCSGCYGRQHSRLVVAATVDLTAAQTGAGDIGKGCGESLQPATLQCSRTWGQLRAADCQYASTVRSGLPETERAFERTPGGQRLASRGLWPVTKKGSHASPPSAHHPTPTATRLQQVNTYNHKHACRVWSVCVMEQEGLESKDASDRSRSQFSNPKC